MKQFQNLINNLIHFKLQITLNVIMTHVSLYSHDLRAERIELFFFDIESLFVVDKVFINKIINKNFIIYFF